MYYVSKKMEIAGSHQLHLPYLSKCSNLHGHNWIVTVYCKGEKLTDYGMLADFTKIKEWIEGEFDHKFINDVVEFNPTAENIAEYICRRINKEIFDTSAFCYKVKVQESKGNVAWYEVE